MVEYWEKIGFEATGKRVIGHTRGDNADYQLTDAMFVTIIGILGGATSMAKVMVVWADGVLRKVAGWLTIPVETSVPRIFQELDGARINAFESLNHVLRGRYWRRLAWQRNLEGRHPGGALDRCRFCPVDSVCGEQEGSAKGYNPKKKGARAYPPPLAFLADTARKSCKPAVSNRKRLYQQRHCRMHPATAGAPAETNEDRRAWG
ncbi:MAG: hypothetical protein ACRERU_11880 [Methylococcales bacterium]